MNINLRPDDLEILRRWAQQNPVDWVREALGLDPTDYQAAILESVRDYRKTSVGSCHSAGKSGVAGMMVVPWFLCAFPGSIVITTAPTFRQVRGILWDRIRAAKSRAKIDLGGKIVVTRWTMGEGWFAEGVTAPPHDPDKFQGFHSEAGRLLCVVDEAAGLSQTLYDGGVMPITVGEDDRLLLIGNTTSTSGEFRASSNLDSGYNYLRVSAFETSNFTETGISLEDIRQDTWEEKLSVWREKTGRSLPRPYLISPVWVADRWKAWGEDSVLFQTRILANFLDESAEVLVPPAWVEAAQERWKDLPDRAVDKKGKPARWWAGLDVANKGADDSVLGSLEEMGHGLIRYRKMWDVARNDTTILVSRVQSTLAEAARLPEVLAVDATGIGIGVSDELANNPPSRGRSFGRAIKTRVHPFMAGASAEDRDRFPNRRSEIAWQVRQLFETGQIAIDPRDDRLAEELSSLQWYQKGKHAFCLESKDDYKTRTGGKSCDHYDALSYAVAAREEGHSGFAFV